MANVPKILAFAGSLRKDSWNKKLVRVAAHGAKAAGAEISLIDLRDFPLPVYDGDIEENDGLPDNAMRLKQLFVASDGLLISSAEYNSSISAVLKNVIDWVSRSAPGETSLAGFKGKVASLMSASPGTLGGLRGLVHLRSILGNIGVIVLPEQIAVVKANDAFDADGALKDPKQQEAVKRLGSNLSTIIAKLKA